VEPIEGVYDFAKIRQAALVPSTHHFSRHGASFDRGSTFNAKHIVFWVFKGDIGHRHAVP